MDWFKTYFRKIEPVKIERHTDSSVWIDGKRRARASDFECFFPTWKEAHEHLMQEADRELQRCRRYLQVAQSNYGNVKGMKEPTNDR